MALTRDAAKKSPLRDDLRPQDVLDPDVVKEVDRTQREVEAAAPGRLADETAWENALDIDDLRELTDRARRGEHISLRKT